MDRGVADLDVVEATRMIGDKYREIDSRRVIYVKPVPFLSTEVYKIYQGAEFYDGTLSGNPISGMVWTEMAKAQEFLDRLAKVREWKLVKK